MAIKYLSVCSGIEAATVAWHELGWEPVAFSEIEPFPCKVLAHHYPNTPNWGDMTKFKEWPDATIDALVGGTPCQSFSVAGLRQGLEDPRGELMLTYLAIAARYRPQWVIWENVPGVLSSNGGRDFGAFLGALGQLGYGWAYRVLDAQWFGVAQRRRRVFVVGCFGDSTSAAKVLFESESVCRNPPSRRSQKEDIAGTIAKCSFVGGASGGSEEAAGNHFIGVMPGQTMHGKDVFPCLDSTSYKKGWCDQAVRQGLGVFCLSSGQANAELTIDYAPTLNCLHEAPVVLTSELSGTQYASTDVDRGMDVMAFDTTQITSAANYSSPKPGDPCHPLAAGAHPPAVLVPDVARTLNARHDSSHCVDRGMDVVAFHPTQDPISSQGVCHALGANANATAAVAVDVYNHTIDGDIAATLNAQSGAPNHSGPKVMQAMQVRRLTVTECERLQGFPDDYTNIPGAKDGPRYKALGNSMAVPCMRWIGERLYNKYMR